MHAVALTEEKYLDDRVIELNCTYLMTIGQLKGFQKGCQSDDCFTELSMQDGTNAMWEGVEN